MLVQYYLTNRRFGNEFRMWALYLEISLLIFRTLYISTLPKEPVTSAVTAEPSLIRSRLITQDGGCNELEGGGYERNGKGMNIKWYCIVSPWLLTVKLFG